MFSTRAFLLSLLCLTSVCLATVEDEQFDRLEARVRGIEKALEKQGIVVELPQYRCAAGIFENFGNRGEIPRHQFFGEGSSRRNAIRTALELCNTMRTGGKRTGACLPYRQYINGKDYCIEK